MTTATELAAIVSLVLFVCLVLTWTRRLNMLIAFTWLTLVAAVAILAYVNSNQSGG